MRPCRTLVDGRENNGGDETALNSSTRSSEVERFRAAARCIEWQHALMDRNSNSGDDASDERYRYR